MATARGLLKKFNSMKTLPHVAIRLSRLLSDENSSMHKFEEVIRMDPTLVLRLLRLINSPYYGLEQKVDSITRAVVFIGMKNLRNMLVIEALKDIFKKRSNDSLFSRSHLWLHCASVGICSQMISERIFEQQGEDAFLCGILHDIGMIVEDQVEQDLFIQACKAYNPESKPFTTYEKKIIGTDHCAVGCLLASDWKLPLEIQQAIKDHHKLLDEISPESITGILQIAEYMVSRLNYSAMPGMKAILSSPLAVHIQENIEEYKALDRDLPNEILTARDLYESHES